MGLELEPNGFENNIPIRIIFTDDKSEILFQSIAAASRKTGINPKSIRDSLNPIAKKKFSYENRAIVFRIKK
jgi:hypothetical protein